MTDPRFAWIVLPALAFAFMNGANDSGTMAASVVSSRTLSPRRAALVAAAASLLGALLLGTAVARTLGRDLVLLGAIPASADPFQACVAAAAAALLWSALAWWWGLPGSYTHALLGGWLGAFAAIGGPGVVQWGNAGIVLGAVLLTPFLGLLAAWWAIRFLYWAGSELSTRTLPTLRRVETGVFALLSFAHGANAAQKSMALIVVAGFALGAWPPPERFVLPLWVRLVCSAGFAAGVLLGFTGTLKTMGFGIFRVGTLHSFTALTTSGALILASTLAGLPLSPGQINSSSLLGAGAGHNHRAVRWDIVGDLFTNWALTFPGAAVLAYGLAKL